MRELQTKLESQKNDKGMLMSFEESKTIKYSNFMSVRFCFIYFYFFYFYTFFVHIIVLLVYQFKR